MIPIVGKGIIARILGSKEQTIPGYMPDTKVPITRSHGEVGTEIDNLKEVMKRCLKALKEEVSFIDHPTIATTEHKIYKKTKAVFKNLATINDALLTYLVGFETYPRKRYFYAGVEYKNGRPEVVDKIYSVNKEKEYPFTKEGIDELAKYELEKELSYKKKLGLEEKAQIEPRELGPEEFKTVLPKGYEAPREIPDLTKDPNIIGLFETASKFQREVREAEEVINKILEKTTKEVGLEEKRGELIDIWDKIRNIIEEQPGMIARYKDRVYGIQSQMMRAIRPEYKRIAETLISEFDDADNRMRKRFDVLTIASRKLVKVYKFFTAPKEVIRGQYLMKGEAINEAIRASSDILEAGEAITSDLDIVEMTVTDVEEALEVERPEIEVPEVAPPLMEPVPAMAKKEAKKKAQVDIDWTSGQEVGSGEQVFVGDEVIVKIDARLDTIEIKGKVEAINKETGEIQVATEMEGHEWYSPEDIRLANPSKDIKESKQGKYVDELRAKIDKVASEVGGKGAIWRTAKKVEREPGLTDEEERWEEEKKAQIRDYCTCPMCGKRSEKGPALSGCPRCPECGVLMTKEANKGGEERMRNITKNVIKNAITVLWSKGILEDDKAILMKKHANKLPTRVAKELLGISKNHNVNEVSEPLLKAISEIEGKQELEIKGDKQKNLGKVDIKEQKEGEKNQKPTVKPSKPHGLHNVTAAERSYVDLSMELRDLVEDEGLDRGAALEQLRVTHDLGTEEIDEVISVYGATIVGELKEAQTKIIPQEGAGEKNPSVKTQPSVEHGVTNVSGGKVDKGNIKGGEETKQPKVIKKVTQHSGDKPVGGKVKTEDVRGLAAKQVRAHCIAQKIDIESIDRINIGDTIDIYLKEVKEPISLQFEKEAQVTQEEFEKAYERWEKKQPKPELAEEDKWLRKIEIPFPAILAQYKVGDILQKEGTSQTATVKRIEANGIIIEIDPVTEARKEEAQVKPINAPAPVEHGTHNITNPGTVDKRNIDKGEVNIAPPIKPPVDHGVGPLSQKTETTEVKALEAQEEAEIKEEIGLEVSEVSQEVVLEAQKIKDKIVIVEKELEALKKKKAEANPFIKVPQAKEHGLHNVKNVGTTDKGNIGPGEVNPAIKVVPPIAHGVKPVSNKITTTDTKLVYDKRTANKEEIEEKDLEVDKYKLNAVIDKLSGEKEVSDSELREVVGKGMTKEAKKEGEEVIEDLKKFKFTMGSLEGEWTGLDKEDVELRGRKKKAKKKQATYEPVEQEKSVLDMFDERKEEPKGSVKEAQVESPAVVEEPTKVEEDPKGTSILDLFRRKNKKEAQKEMELAMGTAPEQKKIKTDPEKLGKPDVTGEDQIIVNMPFIERKDGPGNPRSSELLAEDILRGVKARFYLDVKAGFDHIVGSTKDISNRQKEEIKESLARQGFKV